MTVTADLYAVLGVSREASDAEIKSAYRKLCREYHPDVNPDDAHRERFKEITAAYDILSDPTKRQRYDLGVEGNQFGFGGLNDIFEAFFGAGFGGGATRGPRGRVRQGADLLAAVSLQLADAAFGASNDVTFDTAVVCPTCTGSGCAEGTHPDTCSHCRGRGEVSQVVRSFLGQVMTSRPCPQCGGVGSVIEHPCKDCGGAGRVSQRRTLTVKVPAGVEHGMRIRLTGEGEAGPGGGPSGDLFVECHVADHDVFERDGDDLHCSVTLPMTTAALGTTLTLQTLDSEEQIVVKAGTQSGHVLTLRARGVPHLRGSGRGDLHVHVEVQTPTHVDAEQEKLLRELARIRGDEDPKGDGGQGLFGRLRDAFGGR